MVVPCSVFCFFLVFLGGFVHCCIALIRRIFPTRVFPRVKTRHNLGTGQERQVGWKSNDLRISHLASPRRPAAGIVAHVQSCTPNMCAKCTCTWLTHVHNRPALHPVTLQYDDTHLEHLFKTWHSEQMNLTDHQGAWLVAFLIVSTTVRDMVIMLTSSARHTLVLGTSNAHRCAQLHMLLVWLVALVGCPATPTFYLARTTWYTQITLRLVFLSVPTLRKRRDLCLQAFRTGSCLPLLLTIPLHTTDAASPSYVAAVVMYVVCSSFVAPTAAKLLFKQHLVASVVLLAGLTLLVTKTPWNAQACNVCVGICHQAKHGNASCAEWVEFMIRNARPLYGALHQHLRMLTGRHDASYDTPCLTACALSLLASHLIGMVVVSIMLYYRELQMRMRYLYNSGVAGSREAVEAFKRSGLAAAWTLSLAANLTMWSWVYLLIVAFGLHFLL